MDTGERFTRLLVTAQPRLYGFIFSLVHDRAAADDLLQEVSSLLWRKFAEFREGTDFAVWAMQVARLKIFEWRRQQASGPLQLSDEELGLLADQSARMASDYNDMRDALDQCLRRLNHRQQQLVQTRYREDVPVSQLAEEMGRSRVAVYKALAKIHALLLKCIQLQLEPARQ